MKIYKSNIVGNKLKACVVSINDAQVKYYLKFDDGTMPNTKKSKLQAQYTPLFLNAFTAL